MLTLSLSVFLLAPAAADTYPNRAITYILSSGAGSGPDQMVRGLMPKLSEKLGVSIVVDNRPGAGGLIAMNALGAANPDGYTIGHGNIQTLAISPHLAEMSMDALKNIDYVGLIGTAPNILVAGPSISKDVASLPALIAHAKQHPGKLSYASGGNGTSHHLGMELFKQISGLDILHIPYKSTPAGINDLVGGRIDLAMDTISGPSSKMELSTSGVRRLASTGKTRSTEYPDLPTMAEAALPSYAVTAWSGLIAPKGMAPDKLKVLNDALNETLKDPDIIRFLESIGYTAVPVSPQFFQQFSSAEREKWGQVIRKIGMTTN
jgi:tripartite-type tricarboxylate transporter receptor subunit TctC